MGVISDDVQKCDSARIDRMAAEVSDVLFMNQTKAIEAALEKPPT